MHPAGVKKDALRRRRFSGVYMRHNAYIADICQ
jgi:hypothetical protein